MIRRTKRQSQVGGDGGTQIQSQNIASVFIQPVFNPLPSESLTHHAARDIGNRAAAATRHAVDLQINRFFEPLCESQELSNLLDGFLEYKWLGSCTEAVDRIQEFGYADEGFPSLFVEWMQDEWLGTYESVARLLRTEPYLAVERYLKRKAAEAERRDAWAELAESISLRRALKDITFLSQQGARPRFGACLPILGDWGAGKSRALTELAERARHRGHWIAFLSGSDLSHPIADICRAVGDLVGISGSDACGPDDLLRRLNALASPELLIVIDDLDDLARHNPVALDQLQSLIERTAVHGTIRWAFTADTASFDSIETSIPRSVSFARYSYASADRRGDISGWLVLDEINTRDRVGQGIIDRNGTAEISAQFNRTVDDSDLAGRHIEVLKRPAFAWLFLDVLETTASNLLNLSLDEFVEQYLGRSYASLDLRSATADDLRYVIRIIANKFATEQNVGEFDIHDLRGKFPDRDGDFNELFFTNLLPLLREVGLLRSSVLGDADIEDVIEVAIPSMPPIWGRRVSSLLHLESVSGADFATRIGPWAEMAGSGDEIAQAVCEFALRDRFSNSAASQVATEAMAWRWSANWSQSPLILASIEATEPAQQALVTALKGGWKLTSRRDQFAVMRAASLMPLRSWRAPERLTALQSLYGPAATSGLGPYLLHTAIGLVSDAQLCSRDDFHHLLPTFHGIEGIGDTATLARTVVTRASSLFVGDEKHWIRILVAYLDMAGTPSNRQFYPEPHTETVDLYQLTGGGYGFERPRSSFWHELVFFALGDLSESCGVRLFGLLMDAGWYELAFDPRLDTDMGRALRREANIRLGASFRAGDEGQADYFLSVVGDLVDGEFDTNLSIERQRDTALFLIRHTSPTRGRRKVRVDERFRPHLSRLRDLADFAAHENDFLKGLLEANGLA